MHFCRKISKFIILNKILLMEYVVTFVFKIYANREKSKTIYALFVLNKVTLKKGVKSLNTELVESDNPLVFCNLSHFLNNDLHNKVFRCY